MWRKNLAENIISYLKAHNNIENIKLINGKGAFVDSFANSLKKKNRLNKKLELYPIESILFSEIRKDTQSFTSKIPKDGSTVLIINLSPFYTDEGNNGARTVLGAAREGCPQCLFIANETSGDEWMWEFIEGRKNTIGDISRNLIFSLPYHYGIDKKFSSKFNRDGNFFDPSSLKIPMTHRAYLTYDSVYVLIDAIDKGITENKEDGSIRKDLPKLIRDMTKQSNYYGMTGPITIPDKSSDRKEHLNGLVKVQFNEKGKIEKLVRAE